MSNDKFRRLLTVMPEIAEVINIFDSEAAQLRALDALIQSAEAEQSAGPVPKPMTVLTSNQSPASVSEAVIMPTPNMPELEAGTVTVERAAKKTRRVTGKKTFNIIRNMNFAPDGKQSLAEFVEAKQPRNMHEMNVVACYYLQEIMEVQAITVGHVLAVYQVCSWSASSQPDTYLRKTASEHGWLDTQDGSDIKVVWNGINYVKNKMPNPAPQRGKK